MKKSVIILFAVVALFSMAQVAGAYNGQVKFLGGDYEVSPGGEFTFQILPGSNFEGYVNSYASTTHDLSGFVTPNFQTFCLEGTEYISGGGIYNANVTGKVINGGLPQSAGGDPVSQGTAWLYQQFAMGSLIGYTYSGSGRLTSAAQLQNAIWYLEDEKTPPDFSNPFIALVDGKFGSFADAQVTNFGGEYGVWALNLYDTNGDMAQDQLIWDSTSQTVPEPGSILLLGFGLLGLFGVARRRVK